MKNLMNNKTVCFTGHRPSKLKGYFPEDNKELLWEIHDCCVHLIENEDVSVFINGVALGVDQWSAKVVIKLKEKYPHIKLISAVPCLNHSSKWTKNSKKDWQDIIDKSDEVKYVTEEKFTPYCMQLRNKWMVDNSDIVVSVWDGSAGGTNNCVQYATENKKRVINLWKKEYGK